METLCSICAVIIDNYIPDYFLGERFNRACDKCKESDKFDGISSSADQEPLTIDPVCDKCDDNSEDNISEVETFVKDDNIPLQSAQMDNRCLNDIDNKFEVFLRNFRGKENSPKYETLALELVKT